MDIMIKYSAIVATLFVSVGCAQLPGVAQTVGPVADAPVERTKMSTTPQYFFPENIDLVTDGGRGGKVIKVTSLDNEGPGTLREAIEAEGPRIIVFEVGGVIDLDRQSLVIRNSDVTIAGQTAPSPGISVIRSGIVVAADDVIIQHIRVRPGDADYFEEKWDTDSITTSSVSGVIVDHCTLTWSTDENLSASGPRFTGETPDEWREGASHDILYSHNLIAEGLSNATHAKFEHSKGSLIHDNTSNILIYGNVYAHNYERSPLFKGGVHGAIVNNLIYNPGQRAIHYNLQGLEWGDEEFQTGQMDVVGNVLRAGPSTDGAVPLVLMGGDGDLKLHMEDNIAVDHYGKELPKLGRYSMGEGELHEVADMQQSIEGLDVIPARHVEGYVLASSGARPWDRDKHDVRVLADVAEGRGKIIDSQSEIGGYPQQEPTFRAFDSSLWDMKTMKPVSEKALDSGQKSKGT